MIGIGLRVVSNSEILYSIVERDDDDNLDYIVIDKIIIPLSLEEPERLNYIRNTFVDIYDLYKVDNAVIRVSENTGRMLTNKMIARHYAEGVLLESFASSTIKKYLAGRIVSLNTYLSLAPGQFLELTDVKDSELQNFYDQAVWQKKSKECRESILGSLAALNL